MNNPKGSLNFCSFRSNQMKSTCIRDSRNVLSLILHQQMHNTFKAKKLAIFSKIRNVYCQEQGKVAFHHKCLFSSCFPRAMQKFNFFKPCFNRTCQSLNELFSTVKLMTDKFLGFVSTACSLHVFCVFWGAKLTWGSCFYLLFVPLFFSLRKCAQI